MSLLKQGHDHTEECRDELDVSAAGYMDFPFDGSEMLKDMQTDWEAHAVREKQIGYRGGNEG